MSGPPTPADRWAGLVSRLRAQWRALLPVGLLATAGLVLLALGTPYASGAFTTRVVNNNDVTSSDIFSCDNLAEYNNAYFAYPFAETGGTTAADASGNNRPGTYGALLGVPVGITFGVAGPCPRDAGKAVTLNGSTGYITTNTSIAGPNTFSEEIWFRTNTTRGGKLIGFGSSQTGSSGSYDRHLYMANNGLIYFGVYPGTVRTVVSTKAYNDNAWHQAVATLAPSTDPNPGMRLYLDGVLIATDPSTTTAQSYSGYWRIGYDNLNAWTATPTSNFFAGSLAWAQVYTTALTPDQVRGMYTAGSP